MFRRQPATTALAEPDPDLMRLVETATAAARTAASRDEAIACVLRDVADTFAWPAAHVWVPDGAGAWRSAGIWHTSDGIGLGGLRRACVEAEPAPARGHIALALHLEGTQWVGDLGGQSGTPRHDAAVEAGIAAAVALPVLADGRPVAVLEWYLTSGDPLDPDVLHALGHLSGVLTEVAERPIVVHVPEQRNGRSIRETLRWVTEDGVLSRLLAT